jgi:crotonobetainyl-CoA:carnitine CoA-transferase CaiB-like acyl-CoA transferase
MLAPRESGARPSPRHGPDPVAGLSVVLLGVLCAGLLAAAVLATYGYYVPAVEAPVVGSLAALFGLVLLMNLGALTARRLRGR